MNSILFFNILFVLYVLPLISCAYLGLNKRQIKHLINSKLTQQQLKDYYSFINIAIFTPFLNIIVSLELLKEWRKHDNSN